MDNLDTLNLERLLKKDYSKYSVLYARSEYEELILNLQEFNQQLGNLYEYTIIDLRTIVLQNKIEVIKQLTYKVGDFYYIYFENTYDNIIKTVNETSKKNKDYQLFDSLYALNCMFVYPISDFMFYDKEVVENLKKLLMSYVQKIEYNKSSLYMISMNKYGSYDLTGYELKENYKLKEPDIHYGDGFSDFHKKLLSSLKKNTKGIVLLYGESGAGKTYYLKCLMNELKKIKKNVIYFPNRMIEYLSDPGMFTFLYEELSKYNDENFVFLLEDCEDYLFNRSHLNNKNVKIYDLLNASDGIMNELLNVQFIATFNTNITNIDDSFLRPQRLIAKREFKKLSVEQSKKLVEYLHLDMTVDREYSLAEIYSIYENNSIIDSTTSNSNTSSNKIGFTK